MWCDSHAYGRGLVLHSASEAQYKKIRYEVNLPFEASARCFVSSMIGSTVLSIFLRRCLMYVCLPAATGIGIQRITSTVPADSLSTMETPPRLIQT